MSYFYKFVRFVLVIDLNFHSLPLFPLVLRFLWFVSICDGLEHIQGDAA